MTLGKGTGSKMYDFYVNPAADKIFKRISKKNPRQLRAIHSKIVEIRRNPFHKYKFLKNPLQMINRVHIDRRFVLLFRVDHGMRSIEILYFDHHDKVYQWRG